MQSSTDLGLLLSYSQSSAIILVVMCYCYLSRTYENNILATEIRPFGQSALYADSCARTVHAAKANPITT